MTDKPDLGELASAALDQLSTAIGDGHVAIVIVAPITPNGRMWVMADCDDPTMAGVLGIVTMRALRKVDAAKEIDGEPRH